MAHQQQPPPSTTGGEPASSERRRLLLLGGTGFVGSEICRQAAARGWSCVVLSRRGGAEGSAEQARLPCQHVAGDATQPGVLERTVAEHGPFDALVHCVGALLDGASGLRYANLLVSASRSLPAADQSYADLTEGTALELLRVARAASADGSKDGLGGRTPFVFISAAEAGWADEGAPMPGGSFVESWSPQWLRRYLAAKRSVEGAILSPSATQDVRGVVLRPSFVWVEGGRAASGRDLHAAQRARRAVRGPPGARGGAHLAVASRAELSVSNLRIDSRITALS
jgi:nucleoside-diphosphate-sugar epimerase